MLEPSTTGSASATVSSLVVDEWDSAESFQRFISSDELAAVMGEMGAQGEPEVDIAEAVDSPDQF